MLKPGADGGFIAIDWSWGTIGGAELVSAAKKRVTARVGEDKTGMGINGEIYTEKKSTEPKKNGKRYWNQPKIQ